MVEGVFNRDRNKNIGNQSSFAPFEKPKEDSKFVDYYLKPALVGLSGAALKLGRGAVSAFSSPVVKRNTLDVARQAWGMKEVIAPPITAAIGTATTPGLWTFLVGTSVVSAPLWVTAAVVVGGLAIGGAIGFCATLALKNTLFKEDPDAWIRHYKIIYPDMPITSLQSMFGTNPEWRIKIKPVANTPPALNVLASGKTSALAEDFIF